MRFYHEFFGQQKTYWHYLPIHTTCFKCSIENLFENKVCVIATIQKGSLLLSAVITTLLKVMGSCHRRSLSFYHTKSQNNNHKSAELRHRDKHKKMDLTFLWCIRLSRINSSIKIIFIKQSNQKSILAFLAKLSSASCIYFRKSNYI